MKRREGRSIPISRRGFLAGLGTTSVVALVAACSAPAAAPAPPSGPTAAPQATAPQPTAAPVVAQARKTVRAAWVAKTAGQMQWLLAQDAGLFPKYGVDVDLKYINGSTVAVPALLAGDVDTVAMAGSAVVSARAAGSDILMVAGFQETAIFRVVAVASIARMDDLKGKTVAVTGVGSNDYFAWQTIIKQLGWGPNDVTAVAASTVDGQVAMLQRGDVQAIAVSPPNNVIAEKLAGAHEVLDTATLGVPEQNLGMTVTRAYFERNRDACLGILKATVEATRRYRDDPAFAKQVLRKYLGYEDPAVIDAGYEAYVPIFPEEPYPSAPGFQKVIDEIATKSPNAANLKPADCMDTSLVDELKSSGFIKQIFS